MRPDLIVERHGDGDIILMVHGLGGTANTWFAQRRLLERGFQVICPDLPGSGRTPANGPVSIDSLVADLLGLIESTGSAPVHLVGHSMGTILCQHLAARHPQRVRSLVLMGPLAEPPDGARKALGERAQLARREGMVPIADALVQASISTATRAANPVAAAFVREVLMRQPADGYAATCEALAAARAADAGAIRCPTLLITGDEDGVGPPARCRELAGRIAGARLIVLPSTGHWTPIERPDAVNRALLEFYYGP